ncbi:ArgR family transcriptional regulator [Thalassotalea fonticola]|uniref:Arginine repressor n=1 Tax=Thalassotalea fonticola TaxID=3065649 RepID=A0ABZ0GJZ9_9GAMM|nr:ArgR family transcriptional regulator [Colwelliaceae bacterium S1-1]
MQQRYSKGQNRQLLTAFTAMLEEGEFRTQNELSDQLSQLGFNSISQPKISRMLKQMGAVRIRNAMNHSIYSLPIHSEQQEIKDSINALALEVINNGVQIILKTTFGGGAILANILDDLDDSFGILATMAVDSTVLIIPRDINNIDELSNSIKKLVCLT